MFLTLKASPSPPFDADIIGNPDKLLEIANRFDTQSRPALAMAYHQVIAANPQAKEKPRSISTNRLAALKKARTTIPLREKKETIEEKQPLMKGLPVTPKTPQQLAEAAVSGDAGAQYRLARLYHDEKQYQLAAEWANLAAKQGNVDAWCLLGAICQHFRKEEKASKYFSRVDEESLHLLKDAQSFFEYANAPKFPLFPSAADDMERLKIQVYDLWLISAWLGNCSAKLAIAQFWQQAGRKDLATLWAHTIKKGDKSYDETQKLLRELNPSKGSGEGGDEAKLLSEIEELIATDKLALAIEQCKNLANRGSLKALQRLAFCYACVPDSFEQIACHQVLVACGDTESMHALTKLYSDATESQTTEVSKPTEKGDRYHRYCQLDQKGTDRLFLLAPRLYQAAAESGDIHGMINYGSWLHGLGRVQEAGAYLAVIFEVPPELLRGKIQPDLIRSLAHAHLKGDGVEQDDSMAVRFARVRQGLLGKPQGLGDRECSVIAAIAEKQVMKEVEESQQERQSRVSQNADLEYLKAPYRKNVLEYYLYVMGWLEILEISNTTLANNYEDISTHRGDLRHTLQTGLALGAVALVPVTAGASAAVAGVVGAVAAVAEGAGVVAAVANHGKDMSEHALTHANLSSLERRIPKWRHELAMACALAVEDKLISMPAAVAETTANRLKRMLKCIANIQSFSSTTPITELADAHIIKFRDCCRAASWSETDFNIDNLVFQMTGCKAVEKSHTGAVGVPAKLVTTKELKAVASEMQTGLTAAEVKLSQVEALVQTFKLQLERSEAQVQTLKHQLEQSEGERERAEAGREEIQKALSNSQQQLSQAQSTISHTFMLVASLGRQVTALTERVDAREKAERRTTQAAEAAEVKLAQLRADVERMQASAVLQSEPSDLRSSAAPSGSPSDAPRQEQKKVTDDGDKEQSILASGETDDSLKEEPVDVVFTGEDREAMAALPDSTQRQEYAVLTVVKNTLTTLSSLTTVFGVFGRTSASTGEPLPPTVAPPAAAREPSPPLITTPLPTSPAASPAAGSGA